MAGRDNRAMAQQLHGDISLEKPYQYESVSADEMPDVHPAQRPQAKTLPEATVFSHPLPPIARPSHQWKPRYFRRRTLTLFFLLFLAIIAALQALRAVSRRNDGLGTSHAGLHYLWTYGPVAFLTLVAALWSRVEYQTRMMAPWVRLSKRPGPADQTLLLDYVSMAWPMALYKSIAHRDAAVAAATAVSVLIKVLIILSTGLITLTSTRVTLSSVDIVLEDTFITEPVPNNMASSLPYHVMQGLLSGNISFPPGMSKDFAYQTTSLSNLDISAETEVTVDALENDLHCQPADLTLHYSTPINTVYRNKSNFTVSVPGCSAYFETPGSRMTQANTSTARFALIDRGQCKETTGNEGRRLLVLFGLLNYTVDYSQSLGTYKDGNEFYEIVGTMINSTQLLCEPTYNITQVNVVRNGTQGTDIVNKVPGAAKKTIDSITGWNIMDAQFDAFLPNIQRDTSNGIPADKFINISQTPIEVTASPHMQMALNKYFAENVTLASLYEPPVLQGVVETYYRQIGAIVAKQRVMMETSEPKPTTKGSVTAYKNRLLVREWSTQLMAGITAICAVLSVVILFACPKKGILPRSPASLAGTAALISRSPDVLGMLRDAGAADEKAFRRYLGSSDFAAGPSHDRGGYQIHRIEHTPEYDSPHFPQYEAKNMHPTILHFASRSGLCLLMIGLVLALELTLRRSKEKQCLAYAEPDGYIHYAWTAIPAIVFGLLAMVISITDFEIRTILPYASLKKGVTGEEFVKLDYLDRSLPGRLYRQVKMNSISGFSASLTVLLGSFFTIFAGALFQAHPSSTSSPIELTPLTSFPQSVSGYSASGYTGVW